MAARPTIAIVVSEMQRDIINQSAPPYRVYGACMRVFESVRDLACTLAMWESILSDAGYPLDRNRYNAIGPYVVDISTAAPLHRLEKHRVAPDMTIRQ